MFPPVLMLHLVMNLGQHINCLSPHIRMVEVVLNQDSTLDFPKYPHILSICYPNITLGFQSTLLFSKWSCHDIGNYSDVRSFNSQSF